MATYTHSYDFGSFLNGQSGTFSVTARFKTNQSVVTETPYQATISDYISSSSTFVNAPGLANFQLVATNSNKIRDTDPSTTVNGYPKRFVVEGAYVGKFTLSAAYGGNDTPLADYGIVQQVSMRTWSNNDTSNYADNAVPITHHTGLFVTRGPQHSDFEKPAPTTFKPTLNAWKEDIRQLPQFDVPTGNISGSYHRDRETSLTDIYSRGTNLMFGQIDSGWMGEAGGNADTNHKRMITSGLGFDQGEAGFLNNSLQDMVNLASAQAEAGFFFLDMEVGGWPLSISNPETKRRLYLLIKHWKARFPAMTFVNIVQAAYNSYCFLKDGAPNPLAFVDYLTTVNPISETYSPFDFPGGTFSLPGGGSVTYPPEPNVSLFNVFTAFSTDGYGKTFSTETFDKNQGIMQCYASIFEGQVQKKWLGADKRVFLYHFSQNEFDSVSRFWLTLPTGRASWLGKSIPPLWVTMHQIAVNHLLFDGDINWHDRRPVMEDYTRMPRYIQGSVWGPELGAIWEPNQPGTPSPWSNPPAYNDIEGAFAWPYYPYINQRYGKLMLWRLKDCENLWNRKVNPQIVVSVPPFSMDGGNTWITERPSNICHIAAENLPIFFLFTSPAGYLLYSCEPFADLGTHERKVKLNDSTILTVHNRGKIPAIRPINLNLQPWYPGDTQTN